MIEMFWTTLLDLTPIIAVLGFFQIAVLRRPIANPWRVARGLLYVLLGMVLFLRGLEEAIFPLGSLMAEQLTDPGFIASSEKVWWQDYGWVYVFGFAIGWSTAFAEPSLMAIGMKAEQVSGGSISAFGLRVAASLGVAFGVLLGCLRIVLGVDVWLFIIGIYFLIIIQSLFAPKMIIPIAYDLGGVTTSTVTVPMLAALGLGLASSIPGRDPLIDGFGMIAFACACPIVMVLAYAQLSAEWKKRQA